MKSVLLTLFFSFSVCINLIAQTSSKESAAKVNVYYFHVNHRCETCKAVESESKQDIKELFGDDVSFEVYNLDDATGELKGKELEVNAQTLLVVKGETKINLTTEGFKYARTNPEKFKQIIEENIKPLL